MVLSIVIPVKDEEVNLPLLMNEIIAECTLAQIVGYEVLFIDDGSRDKTWSVIEDLKVQHPTLIKAWKFRHNCGKAAALALGFQHAQGELVMTMDGDLQDNPAEIPLLIEKLNEGWDLISGWKKVRHDPWHKTVPSKLFNWTTSQVAGVRLHDFNCGLKLYRREVVETVTLYGDFHRYIPVLAKWNGFRVTEKVVEHRPRIHGVSKYGISRLISGFLDLLTLVFLQRFSRKPLHFFGSIGLLLGLVGMALMGYFGVQWVLTGALHVRPLMVMAITSLILSVQFVSLGLLGEMLNNRTHVKSEFPIAKAIL
jgi:glycosyltransferase involved in cell wall biosynthesis